MSKRYKKVLFWVFISLLCLTATFIALISVDVSCKLQGRGAIISDQSFIPVFLRETIYILYAKTFDIIMEEVPRPLKDFPSLNAFFTRRIDLKFRPIASTPLVSPVDGTIVSYGKVADGWMEQVKGVRYSLKSFIGPDTATLIEKANTSKGLFDLDATLPLTENFCQIPDNLYYIGIYLGPGDYHGVHSPVNWQVKHVRHVPGHLFSVSDWASKLIVGLFTVNERVILNGQWEHGFFSMVPVGAYNVGSISLEFCPNFTTNRLGQQVYTPASDFVCSVPASKGECLSFFNMGSTVVLIFQAPNDHLKWLVNINSKIKLGEAIGNITSK